MPKAYIRSITLETGGYNPLQQKESGTGVSAAAIDWRMRNNNPHIDILSTKARAAAGSGLLGYRELENVDSATQYKSNENKLLISNLKIEIKEIIDESSLIGTWFTNQEFHKYIKFTVLRSNSAMITNALVNGVLAVPDSQSGEYQFTNPWTNEEALGTIINEGLVVPVDTFTLSDVLSSDLLPTDPNHKHFLKTLEGAKTTTSDGLSVYTFSRSIKDTVSKGSTNPKHLSYFVVSYINLELLASDKAASVDDFDAFQVTKEIGYMSPAGIGNVSSEIAIDNFKLHNRSYIFRDPTTGDIWPGAIHIGYHDLKSGKIFFNAGAAFAAGTFGTLTDTFSSVASNKTPLGIRAGLQSGNNAMYDVMKKSFVYYAGESPDSVQPPIKLVRDTVTNNKIQDFRSVERINKLNIDLSLLSSVASSVKFKGEKKSNVRRSFDYPSPETQELGRPKGYFTKLDLTKDLSGQTRFLFGFDFKRFVLNNSTFAGLINESSTATLSSILSYSTIRNIKITRQRVKDSAADQTNKSGAPPFLHDNGYEKFDKEKLPLIMVNMESDSANTAGGQLKPYKGRFGRLSEVELFSKPDLRVRHFSGIDMAMKGHNSGKYQYAIEIDIEDGGEVMMGQIRKRLKSAVSQLELYHNRATQATDQIMKRFTDDAGGTTAESYLSSRLPEVFIDEERGKWPKPGTGPWCKSIDNFINVLKTVTPGGEKNPNGPLAFLGSYEQLAKQIYNLTSPETGNVNSIGSVLDIMKIILQRMDAILGMQAPHPKSRDDFSAAGAGYSDGMARKATNKIRTMKIKYYFSEIYDASSGNVNGYDFLTTRVRRTSARERTPSQLIFNGSGLTTVPRSYYIFRAHEETRKYFQSDSQQINLGPLGSEPGTNFTSHTEHAAYTYLSPSTIRLSSEPKPFRMTGPAASLIAYQDYNRIMTKVILYNLGQGHSTKTDSFGNPRETVGFQPGMPNSVTAYTQKQDLSLKTLMASVLLENNVLVTAYNNPIIDIVNMNPVETGAGPVKSAIAKSEFVVQKIITSQPPTLALGSRLDDNHLNVANDAYNIAPQILNRITAKPPFHEMKDIDITYLLSILLGTSNLVPLGSMSLDEFNLGIPETRKKLMGWVATATNESFGKLIPNQIKSLMQVMRSSFSPGAVKSPIFSLESKVGQTVEFVGGLADTVGNQVLTPQIKDPYHQMDRFGAYYMNYLNIVRVQVLTGYDTNSAGDAIINKPIWRNLDTDLFNEKKNNQLLFCRLIKYDNPIVKNHEHPEVLHMPIIDQYFFIENEDVITTTPANRYPDIGMGMSSDIMKTLVDQERVNSLVSVEYTSTSPVNSAAFTSGARPIAASRSVAAATGTGTTTTSMTTTGRGSTGGGGRGGY